jgi:Cu+-exporting ATPase
MIVDEVEGIGFGCEHLTTSSSSPEANQDDILSSICTKSFLLETIEGEEQTELGDLMTSIKEEDGITIAEMKKDGITCKLTLDITKIGLRQVVNVFKSHGYQATLKKDDGKEDIRVSIQRSYAAKRNRFVISFFMEIPILFLIWGVVYIKPLNPFVTWLSLPNGPSFYVFLTFAFAMVIQSYCGIPQYISAFKALLHKSANMDALIVLGTSSTMAFGILMFFIGYRDFQPGSRGHFMKCMEHAHHFEVAATLQVLIALGKVLESYSKKRTVKKLTDLASMSVSKAMLFTPANEDGSGLEGSEEEILVEFLEVGDLVKVANGNSVPADGVVIVGQGYCNEAMLTGESKT